MALADWARWMQASVCLYLESVAATHSIPALSEGLEERTAEYMQAGDRIEIRVNGPFTRKYSGLYEARLYVNVLVTSRFGDNVKNVYSLADILGWVHDALDAGIPLLRTGSSDDDQVQIGCLSVEGEVKVFHFGQINADDLIRQGMVTAAYSYQFER
jgi:hypothetical protein